MSKLYTYAQSLYLHLKKMPLIGAGLVFVLGTFRAIKRKNKKDPWEVLSLHANIISGLRDAQLLFNGETKKELEQLRSDIARLQKEYLNLKNTPSQTDINDL